MVDRSEGRVTSTPEGSLLPSTPVYLLKTFVKSVNVDSPIKGGPR